MRSRESACNKVQTQEHIFQIAIAINLVSSTRFGKPFADSVSTANFCLTWFDKNGKAARGGEIPVEALPQALDFAIRKGYVSLCP